MKKKNNGNINFSPNALPHNRKEQFRDILSHRYILLILTSFFVFLGLIPLIFAYACSVYISNTSVFLELIKDYNIPAESQGFVYFWIINFSYLLMIPLFMLGMLFLCGGIRIYRLIAWDEGVFFFHDFFRGIKNNFKSGLLIGLFIGLYLFIFKFIGGSFTLYVNGGLGIGVEIFFKAVLLIFILPIAIITLFMTTYFKDKFFVSIKNAFYIYIGKSYLFFLFSLFLLIIYVFPYFGNYYLILVGVVLIMLFVVPIYILLWNQLILSRIDAYVDDDEIRQKGLYHPKESKDK